VKRAIQNEEKTLLLSISNYFFCKLKNTFMPTLIFPSSSLLISPLSVDSGVGTSCNYLDPTQNQMDQTTVAVGDVLGLATNFKDYMAQKLGGVGSAEEMKMVYHSSFRVADILHLISQNLDCGFLRVYSCRDANGSQLKIMVPMHPSGVVKSTSSAVYLSDCCRCRPECG
jgi:hypothetical protein